MPAPEIPDGDDFNGTTPHMIQCIEALVSMSDRGVLAPHGLCGHARTLLLASANRLRQLPAPSVPDVLIRLRDKVKRIPQRKEYLGGQQFAYVRLCEVIGEIDGLLQSAPQATAISVRLINALREMKARAYKQLDHGKGRAIFIDSNIAIDIADALLQSAEGHSLQAQNEVRHD